MVDGYYWWFIQDYSEKKNQVEAEMNENEKAVSYGSQLLEKAGIFKDFITIIEKALAIEWKPSKVL